MISSAVSGGRRTPLRYGWRAALAAGGLAVLAGCAGQSNPPAPVATAPEAPLAVSAAHFIEHSFVSDDGAQLPLRRWLPRGSVKAVILALHGFNDYGNAFDTPAQEWARLGIATYAYDQRGFGAAPGRGLWPGSTRLAFDAVTAARVLRLMYPGRPLYLLGESMGGAIATLAASGAIPDVAPKPGPPPVAPVDGVILSAPAVWGRDTMAFLPKAALFIGVRIFPEKVMTGSGLHILASDNLPMLRALSRDPMMLKGARVDAIYGMVDLMDAALAAAPHLTAPTLVLYGAHDEVIPPRPMRVFVGDLPAAAPTRRLAYYRHGYHLLLRDLEGPEVVGDVARWLLDRQAPLSSTADAATARTPWPPAAEPGE
ncbi:MAG: lysophospholipase [Alphaproteobacteria bacterium]|nr:lysophospholipase [Alphaproteobacteria bacterium]